MLETNTAEVHFSPAETSHYIVQEDNVDYSSMLVEFGARFVSLEYYWQVGRPKINRGWILHLSVVKNQFIELLQLLLPALLGQGAACKVVRNSSLAASMQDGQLGSMYLGKMIGIYPSNDQHACDLAKY